MPVSKLSEMTWEEVRDLEGSNVVAILPVGAVEAHGPHLPLSTDVIISEAMAGAGAERLSAQGYEVLILPPVAYTTADFAASFPGTISVHPQTVSALLADIVENLVRHGISILAVANSHLDPTHLTSLREWTEATRREGQVTVIFPDVSKRPWAVRLTEEFQSGACHAGRYETSIVMACRPELVREEARSGLPANPVSLSRAIRTGKASFEEAGGARAYFGFPAEASQLEGQRTIETLGAILQEAVLAEVGSPESKDVLRPPPGAET